MESSFSFDKLDLSNNKVNDGPRKLAPGCYICTVANAEYKKNPNSGVISVGLTLESDGGEGSIMDFVVILNPGKTDGAKKNQEIGRDRLKTILTLGGHPNPDHPGDIKTLKGLKVGVYVDEEEYTVRDTGEVRMGSTVRRSGGAYFSPDEDRTYAPPGGRRGGQAFAKQAAKDFQAPASPDLNDDIPF